MIKQFVRGKVYVFVDAANILYSQQTLGWKVDYKKLKEYFEKECNLQAIYFYTGRVGESGKQNKFLEKLELFGYNIRAKEVKRIKLSRNVYEWKGNLDAELIIDALKNSNDFNTCILMSGDSDFVLLLDELKEQGKSVKISRSNLDIEKLLYRFPKVVERAKYINIKKLRDYISYYK